MKTLTTHKMNEIERYGKRVAVIDTWKHSSIETVCTYFFEGLYHTYLKINGHPTKYRTTSKFD